MAPRERQERRNQPRRHQNPEGSHREGQTATAVSGERAQWGGVVPGQWRSVRHALSGGPVGGAAPAQCKGNPAPFTREDKREGGAADLRTRPSHLRDRLAGLHQPNDTPLPGFERASLQVCHGRTFL